MFIALGVNDILFPAFPFTPRQRDRDQGGAFDAVVDFDAVVPDPERPTQLLPAYADPDHLHVNDAGNVAQGSAVPLSLFDPSGPR